MFSIFQRTGTAAATAALAVAIGLSGCSSTPAVPETVAEKTYLDDKSMEAFDRDLRTLALAVQRGDDRTEQSMRTKLAEGARMYQRALMSALFDDSSTPRRAMAGVLLGFSGDSTVIPHLLLKVADREEKESVRVNAVLGLTAMGDKLRYYEDHRTLMTALRVPMADSDSSHVLRRACVAAYAAAYDAAQEDTLLPIRDRFVGDPDIRVQLAAVNAMGDVRDPASVSDLVDVGLRHIEPDLRAASAIALGRIPDPTRCIPALIDASRDESALVRREAQDALSQHYGSNPELVFMTLVNGLSDFDAQVRESAALSLARVRDSRAIEPLLQATGDRTAVVRQAAAESLGSLLTTEREKEAYPLIELLGDNNPGVQSAALFSLAAVTQRDMGNDQIRWRTYFHEKYPDLDPAKMYEGKPKPRVSSGINSSGTRRTTSNTGNRNNNQQRWNNNNRGPQRPQTQPGRNNNNNGFRR